MNIREVMTHNVQVIDPNSNLREAAQMMKDLNVGGLPVCDNDRLLGFVTDRDITVRAVAEGEDPSSCKVSDAMSKQLVWCFEDDNLERAASLMRERKVRRIAVLNRDKRLVGIVALGDISTRAEGRRVAGQALEGISEPSQPSA